MTTLKFVTKKTGNELYLELSGAIDESAELERIEVGDASTITIDMRNINRINSIGIRSWIIWVNKSLTNKKVTLVNCPRSVVDQFSKVHGFLPKTANVRSFWVSYACLNCGHDEEQLFELGKHFTKDGLSVATGRKCSDCGELMEMDGYEARYFSFLKASG
jgi:hypothetical protein